MDFPREEADHVSESSEGNLPQRQLRGKEKLIEDEIIVMPDEGSSSRVARSMNVAHLLPEEQQIEPQADTIAIETSDDNRQEVLSPLETVHAAPDIREETLDRDLDYSSMTARLTDQTPLHPLDLWKEVRLLSGNTQRLLWACWSVFFGILHVGLIVLLTFYTHDLALLSRQPAIHMDKQIFKYAYAGFTLIFLGIYVLSPVPLLSTEVFGIIAGMTLSPLAAFVVSLLVMGGGNVWLMMALQSEYQRISSTMDFLRLCLDLKCSVLSEMVHVKSEATATLMRFTPLPAFTLAPLLAMSSPHYIFDTLFRGIAPQIVYTFLGMSKIWSSRKHVKFLGSAFLFCELVVGPLILAFSYWKTRQDMKNQYLAHQAYQQSEAIHRAGSGPSSPRF